MYLNIFVRDRASNLMKVDITSRDQGSERFSRMNLIDVFSDVCLVDLIVGMLRPINSGYSDRTAHAGLVVSRSPSRNKTAYSGCVVLLCQLCILQWCVSSCVFVAE